MDTRERREDDIIRNGSSKILFAVRAGDVHERRDLALLTDVDSVYSARRECEGGGGGRRRGDGGCE